MNWLHTLWFGYFWSSLKGNGPEDLVAFFLIGGGGVWAVKWALREWREHKAKIDHIIIHHPDIPNVVTGVRQKGQPLAGSQATPPPAPPDQ